LKCWFFYFYFTFSFVVYNDGLCASKWEKENKKKNLTV